MSAKRKLTREEIFDLIPSEATRVKVSDDKGHERWRDISEGFDAIEPSDEIVIVSGAPVTMKGQPGRKKKAPAPKPPPPVNQTVANLIANKAAFFEKDDLLKQIAKGVDSEDILHLVMTGFAQEAASLQFERIEAERTGRETSQLSIRRINALKAIGETWIRRKEQLAGKVIDLESPAFARLFNFLLETFREVMHKGGVPRDQAETVFVELSTRMGDETWEEEARRKMREG